MERAFYLSRVAGLLCVLSPFTAFAGAGDKGYNSPIQFIENKGQVTDQHGVVRRDIDVKIEANGVVLFVGDGDMHYQWVKSRESEVVSRESGVGMPHPTSPKGEEQLPGVFPFRGDRGADSRRANSEVEICRMDVKLVGANKNAQVIFEEPTGYYENYYLAHTGEDGVTAKGFQRVVYKDIYPNIDLVLYTPPAPLKGSDISDKLPISNIEYPTSNIKYDFIVHPGGNPADIQLRYEGATELQLVDGSLIATTPYGSITEEAPYSYMTGSEEPVASAYTLSGNTLSFDVGSYTGTLVIDPALRWGTYYGGVNTYGISAATDTFANGYLCGVTNSSSNIATTGAHQSVFGGVHDGFVVKFDSAGARQWATYYGGAGQDYFRNMATDIPGNIYLVGGTSSSSGIATSGAFQSSLSVPSGGQGSDAFLVKLNGSGARQWATYFGDTSSDGAIAVACDKAGNVYIGGETSSAQNMATNGAYQDTLTTGAGGHGFLAKFSPGGSRIWSTYYNGWILDIDCYADRVYVCGFTNHTTGIATTGAHQPSCPYCFTSTVTRGNGFLGCFDSTGGKIWGSYYGNTVSTPNTVDIHCITTDDKGDVYIGGGTRQTSGIATASTHLSAAPGQYSAFLAKFSPGGTRLWGTYYGGSANDELISIATDRKGDVYAVGAANSTTGIATPNGYTTTKSGNLDALLAQFSPSGQLLWGTYYGGAGWEPYNAQLGYYILGKFCAYSKGKIYLGGSTGTPGNSSGLATSNGHQTSFAGAFLIQFDADTAVFIRQPFTDTGLCIGDTLKLHYGVLQKFRTNNSFTVQLSNSSGSFASATTIGTASTNVDGVINCPIPTVTPGSGYRVRVIGSAPADTSYDNLVNIKIYPKPVNFSGSANSPVCTGDTLKLNSGSTTSGVNYTWSGPGGFSSKAEDTVRANAIFAFGGNYYVMANNNGCQVRDTVNVVIHQTPENITAGSNSPLCSGDTLQLTSSSSTSGVSYGWTGPNSYSTQNVSRPNAQTSDAGTYKVTVTLGSCSDTAVTTVVVNLSPSINIVPTTPTTLCAGDTAQFAAFPNNAGTNPQVQWTKNGVDIPGATGISLKTGNLANGDVIAAELTANTACPGTKESNKIVMTILPTLTPTVSMTADNMPPWNGGLTVTFTATPTHGGANPEYQWKRNGVDVVGATGATWGVIVNALNANEDICVVLKSSYQCAEPDTALSNCITTAFTGVGDVVNDKKIKIYPNPVSGVLHIEGVEAGASIELIDILGRSASKQLLTAQKTVDVRSLAPGVYVLRVNGVVAGRVVKE